MNTNYKDYMNTPLSQLTGNSTSNEKITLQDIAKCTGTGGGLKGTVVRFFNRLIQFKEKGWITDEKVNKLLSQLNTTQLQTITNKMAEVGKKLNDAELLPTPSLSNHDIKKREKELDKVNQVSQNLVKKIKSQNLETVLDHIDLAESLAPPLREINPLSILSHPESTLAKNFADFLYERKIPLSEDNLEETYQDFVSAFTDEIISNMTAVESKDLSESKIKTYREIILEDNKTEINDMIKKITKEPNDLSNPTQLIIDFNKYYEIQ